MTNKPSITQKAVDVLTRELRKGMYAPDTAMPTERQLCERFGVSRMTVRVILSRLESKGLIYRQQGRGTFPCSTERTIKPIALLLRDLDKISSPYLTALLKGANEELMRHGSHVNVVGLAPAEWTHPLSESIAGVIVVPAGLCQADLDCLSKRGLPYIIIMESDLSGPTVTMGSRAAAAAMTRGLLHAGHHRFALLSGHQAHTDRQKRKGIADAFTEAGIEMSSIPDYETDYRPERARYAASAILAHSEQPTAVICFDDTLALQMITMAQQHGLNVPNDMCITGFNDATFSSLVAPTISTVRFPVAEAGAAAARALHNAYLTGAAPLSIHLPHNVIWRDSASWKKS